MKTRMVEEREGEHLGPVDWDMSKWPFQPDEVQLVRLRTLIEAKEAYEVTDDGGWPRCGWARVYEVGMYDGWPYWRPGPAVLTGGIFGLVWVWADRITDIRPARSGGGA